ncbi:hypothetical protein [Cryptosporangium sp. NPDC048952]|uniref:hypothetical protein n=1 Tax=Cryptosporangium sp. NPDC048952 TaxID=3363961 RepID=UPI003716D016
MVAAGADVVRLVPVRIGAIDAHIEPDARSGSLHTVAAAEGLVVLPPSWRPGAPGDLLPVPKTESVLRG